MKKKARENQKVKEYLESDSVNIGNFVFARRTELGLSQQTLADVSETIRSQVSTIESGNADVLNHVFKAALK